MDEDFFAQNQKAGQEQTQTNILQGLEVDLVQENTQTEDIQNDMSMISEINNTIEKENIDAYTDEQESYILDAEYQNNSITFRLRYFDYTNENVKFYQKNISESDIFLIIPAKNQDIKEFFYQTIKLKQYQIESGAIIIEYMIIKKGQMVNKNLTIKLQQVQVDTVKQLRQLITQYKKLQSSERQENKKLNQQINLFYKGEEKKELNMLIQKHKKEIKKLKQQIQVHQTDSVQLKQQINQYQDNINKLKKKIDKKQQSQKQLNIDRSEQKNKYDSLQSKNEVINQQLQIYKKKYFVSRKLDRKYAQIMILKATQAKKQENMNSLMTQMLSIYHLWCLQKNIIPRKNGNYLEVTENQFQSLLVNEQFLIFFPPNSKTILTIYIEATDKTVIFKGLGKEQIKLSSSKSQQNVVRIQINMSTGRFYYIQNNQTEKEALLYNVQPFTSKYLSLDSQYSLKMRMKMRMKIQ